MFTCVELNVYELVLDVLEMYKSVSIVGLVRLHSIWFEGIKWDKNGMKCVLFALFMHNLVTSPFTHTKYEVDIISSNMGPIFSIFLLQTLSLIPHPLQPNGALKNEVKDRTEVKNIRV